ncbi:hypothetical protein L1766_12365 [Thermovorax subterraneus]|nr:hypothetical protein [Thermovorax subterraneus]
MSYRLLKLILILILISSLCFPVFAASPEKIERDYAVSHNIRGLSGDINGYYTEQKDYLIDIWHSRIQDQGNGSVEIYGYTQCNRICDKVVVKLVLQKYTGSSWVDVASYTFTGYDTDYVDGGKVVFVERGKYYRVKSYHYAYDVISDSTTATTNEIYVK